MPYACLARRAIIVLAMLLAGMVLGWASEAAKPTAVQAEEAERRAPVLNAVYTTVPPVIDGRVDDQCWTQSPRLSDFVCPNVDTPPPDETIGLVVVDERYLYVGFICSDKTPDDIAAKETRRNGDISRDDYVLVAIDPWHKHNDFFQFEVTAAGTQTELIPGGSATKIEWRGDWTAAAVRTPTGYQVEMAIPLANLPHAPGQDTFSLLIGRNWAKENLVAVCPNTGRNVDPKLIYDLVGLHLPSTVRRPIVMSYTTFDSAGVGGDTAKAGADLQYRLQNGLTALASVNPDFTQVEDNVEPVSFSYTERYNPDLRPFFVTGEQGYLPPTYLLYTRRIERFDTGVKLFGTIGDDTIGVLDALTSGEQNAFAASWKHQLNGDDAAKLLLVSDRETAAGAGSLAYGLDVNHLHQSPQGSDNVWMELFHTDSEEAGPGSVYWVGGYHDRGGGRLHYDWNLRLATANFKPSLGYYPEINNYGGYLGLGQWDRPEQGALEQRSWYVATCYYPFLDGSGAMNVTVAPSYSWSWRNGRQLWLGLTRGRQYNFDSSDVSLAYGWHSKDLYTNGQAIAVKGHRAGGDYTYLEFGQGLRPAGRLSIRLAAGYDSVVGSEDSDAHDFQGVLTSSYDITKERSIGLRLIARNTGLTGYAAYRQVVRRGMDIYVLLGDPDPDLTHFASRVVVKLIRTM
jgi:hypothetical protein